MMFEGQRSVPYTDENYRKAIQEVSTFTANFGGTEILPPL
jgi:hypothetical protein